MTRNRLFSQGENHLKEQGSTLSKKGVSIMDAYQVIEVAKRIPGFFSYLPHYVAGEVAIKELVFHFVDRTGDSVRTYITTYQFDGGVFQMDTKVLFDDYSVAPLSGEERAHLHGIEYGKKIQNALNRMLEKSEQDSTMF